ncbi:LAMI_0A05116g1_1 [Lachancea mirantina]|uniref:inorganic diphosphatase n=1 Tax=Lachancea mirantina TaxID=1230905 RepID=A0A1G4IPV6_9SACH|nr:LAMI_0A05116g1_1 [Lachancea mirantina]
MSSALRRVAQTASILKGRALGSVTNGSKYTKNFVQYLELPNGEIGSYFHDVPLALDAEHRTINMVVEVPRWSNGKFEVSKEKDYNPIVQDVKDGQVRFVHNIFPFHGYIHNYGSIPQTWEDPLVKSTHPGVQGLKGDNDPLDCCEIGSQILEMGQVRKVKVLGSLAMIDDGELDWKVIVIDAEDPLSKQVNSLKDVETHFPNLLSSTREWFRNYKIPAGKPPNTFAYGGAYRDFPETLSIIQGCHDSWKRLLFMENQNSKTPNAKRAGKGLVIKPDHAPDSTIDPENDKWYYI